MAIHLYNASDFLRTAGYFGLFIIIFAETGLLIGLVLPGESLLFTAGFLSSLGFFNIWVVVPVAFIAAALADSVGYTLGKKYGRKIFYKHHSLFFDQTYIAKAEEFYERHGGKTLIAARFLPFIRTLAPIFAGIGGMHYKEFLKYNVAGAFLWTLVISLLAYFLGETIPNADRYILLIAIGIVLVFMLPTVIAILRNKGSRAKIKTFFKERMNGHGSS
jgi:membrane-associated protein